MYKSTLTDKYQPSYSLGYRNFNGHKVYEKEKGANFYIAKYIDKQVDYDYIWAFKTID